MHDSQGRAAPEGECGYISKTPSTAVLQHFQKHRCSVVLVTIETLSVRYYVARLDTVLEAEKESW